MPKKEKLACPHCGASMNEHHHSLSRKLALCLKALDDAGGTAYVREMTLPKNGGPNFQKLRYWNFITKEAEVDEHGDSRWILTDAGKKFLTGEEEVIKTVWTYRGNVIRYEGDYVRFDQLVVTPGERRRINYERDAQAHFNGHVVKREQQTPVIESH